MTIEKAISMIEYIYNGSGDWCGSLGDGATGIALKMAISGLDKQIPKKPIEKSPWVYHCPRCDSRTIEDAFIKKFKFCPDCGQALDWGDTDD